MWSSRFLCNGAVASPVVSGIEGSHVLHPEPTNMGLPVRTAEKRPGVVVWGVDRPPMRQSGLSQTGRVWVSQTLLRSFVPESGRPAVPFVKRSSP